MEAIAGRVHGACATAASKVTPSEANLSISGEDLGRARLGVSVRAQMIRPQRIDDVQDHVWLVTDSKPTGFCARARLWRWPRPETGTGREDLRLRHHDGSLAAAIFSLHQLESKSKDASFSAQRPAATSTVSLQLGKHIIRPAVALDLDGELRAVTVAKVQILDRKQRSGRSLEEVVES
jgi:hypothetical protein